MSIDMKQLMTSQNDDQVNTILHNLLINDDTNMNLTPKEQELLKIIHIKDCRIRELENCLSKNNNEIAELKSQLDKFQSVFRTSHPGSRKLGNGGRQRAQGISAEPQSERSIQNIMHVNFPKYDKEERLVII